MYRAKLHLIPWPKGAIHLSQVGEGWRKIEIPYASNDQLAIEAAKAHASTLKGGLNLERCEVVRVYEVTEREVPLK